MDRNLPAAVPANTAFIPHAYLNPGLSFGQLWAILYAYRKQSLMILLTILVAAAAATKLMPKTYKATVTLMVNFDVNDPLGGKEFPTGLMSNYMYTQKDLIQSPAVLLMAADQLNLTKNSEYTSGYNAKKNGDLRNYVIEQVAKNLQVELGNYGSQLLYISYSAHSAAEAAKFANTIAHIYADQQFRRTNDPAGERAQRYGSQLDELKKNVEKAQADVTEFRKRTGLVEFNSKTNIGDERLTDLEHRLLEAQEMRRTAEARAVGRGEVQSQALSSNTVQSLKNALATQQAQLAQLRATLGPKHPQIVELRQQMAATQASLDAELRTYTGSVQAEVEGARQREAEVQRSVEAERAKVLQTRQLQDEGAKYVVALEAAQTLYQRALDGYDNVLMASSGRYSNISFVSEATPPTKPAKPKPLLNMAIALVLGLLFGFGGPLLYELVNRRVRCRDDLERELGIPVLVELGRPAYGGHAT